MLLCLNCYKIYNQKTIKNNICKVKECYGDVVEVDELFVPVIAELNRKGYRTRYCCSGHYADEYSSSYIFFAEDYVFPSLPKSYMYDQDLNPWAYLNTNGQQSKSKRNTIRCDFYGNKNKSFNELSKDIFNNAINVLEWAEGLEEFNMKDGGISN